MKRWQRTVWIAGLCGMVHAHAQQSLSEANRLRPALAVHATEPQGPPSSLEEAVRVLFAEADVVFAGTVTRVEHVDGAVLVRFRVEDAVRGVSAGSTFTLREWNGLWVDDPSRYVADERWLMLLHAASAAGYASPVGGGRGAIHLRGDAAQQVADLRWIAADVNAAPATVRALRVTPAVADNSAVDGMLLTDMLHAWQRDGVTQ